MHPANFKCKLHFLTLFTFAPCCQIILPIIRLDVYKRQVQAIFRLFTNSETRVPLPLVRLQLEMGEATDKIFHQTRLFGFRVRVESSRPPGKLAQCHRCQRFSHHTDVCRSAPACLRCSLEHSTQACTVAVKSHYRCINCGEGHAANYSNWPVYRLSLIHI